MVYTAVGIVWMSPLAIYAAVNPRVSVNSNVALSLAGGVGCFIFCVGAAKLMLGHYVASQFQLVYSSEPAKAKKWTRKLNGLSLLVGYGGGAGLAIVYGGPLLADSQKSTDASLIVGFTCTAVFVVICASSCACGVLEIRTLQHAAQVREASSNSGRKKVTIREDLSSGKVLQKKLVLLLVVLTVALGSLGCMCVAIVSTPWLRARAFTISVVVCAPLYLLYYGLAVHELQQLQKREAAPNLHMLRDRSYRRAIGQIVPTSTNDYNSNEKTNVIADMVAATKQALLSNEQQRRDPSASLVLGSGVSVAFLELFIRESHVDATMTANDVVNAHVKPHTKEIGHGGSGAFVELIGDGKDSSGRRWCDTPTHMLSYSWSYSVLMIVDALRTFEREHPSGKGQQCNYYFVDQFALNQHEFAKDCTQQEVEDMMLATLKESIRVPAQMICLLHPWQDPVPFRRVWCLFELYVAITLGAKIIMHFPPKDAEGFYSKLQKNETDVDSKELVSMIDAKQAQATMESDRDRIFREIADSIGMEEFNRQLQEYLETTFRASQAKYKATSRSKFRQSLQDVVGPDPGNSTGSSHRTWRDEFVKMALEGCALLNKPIAERPEVASPAGVHQDIQHMQYIHYIDTI
jgi:hypothetical protein